jgi:uridine phosphorylase
VGGFFGDTYLVKSGDRTAAILANFGIGAPVVVVLLEQFAALGVGEFVSIGMAGGLAPGAQAGDLIVCNRALRDEGVSYHYQAPSRYAVASGPLTRQIQACLEAAVQAYRLGPVWTTDAPFRETLLEVEQYRREGILAVEMEAAALFAAGQSLGVQVAAAFAVGDSLEGPPVTSPPPGGGAQAGQPAGPDPGLHWRLDFDFGRTLHGLMALTEAALRAGKAGCG